uniref:Zinc finger, CCHC domain containing 4 n=1 Tax=Sinocyclocheilus anshuiensis TaxID=1608454 RepID=A0A671QSE6_9TELE
LKSLILPSTSLFFCPLRYCQFYGQDEFCRYNMFNHHFFDDEEAVMFFQGFLREEGGAKVVMVTEPPFGGLVKPLANSFSQMSITWKNQNKAAMPMIRIFPYYFESRILEYFPSFSMLIMITTLYINTERRAVSNIILPEDEGYRFCSVCERYVSAANKHCPKCDTCPSKDGREWRHCDESWRHCSSCGHCALPDHPCGPSQTGCFNCGSQKHKHRACPNTRNGEHKPGLLRVYKKKKKLLELKTFTET